MTKKILILSVIFIFALSEMYSQGFLRISGKKIVNEKGENFILRGMGLGGWMLQEPYMLKLSGATGPQHDIETKIEDLIGKQAKEKFYEAWYANHCTERDIDSLAAWGFNHVRLPMHYNLFTLPIEKEPVKGKNTWLQKGFDMTDSLLKWCAKNKMYVVLDLHAAPGGQGKDSNISDYDPAKPSIWESEENKKKTIALWRKLAEHYADEPWIGGYDLLNEPNWRFSDEGHPNGIGEKNNDDIWNLYKEIIKEIRKVDKKHIIYLEGNAWAGNFIGFPKDWDKNTVINFHQYWNKPDWNSFAGFLRLREEYNMPLYMSESGENSNEWFKIRIQNLEEHNIGWAWWPMKKLNNVVGPYSAPITGGYLEIIDYWRNGGEKPSPEFATKTLMQIAENLKSENCEYHPDVIDAMFRQTTEINTIPYKKHKIPCEISAVDYDMGSQGFAYSDNEFLNQSGKPGGQVWNKGRIYRNDGVDIGKDKKSDEFFVNSFEIGEWLKFSTKVKKTKKYRFNLKLSSPKGGKVYIEIFGRKKPLEIEIPKTQNNDWISVKTEKIEIKKGSLSFKIGVTEGEFALKQIIVK